MKTRITLLTAGLAAQLLLAGCGAKSSAGAAASPSSGTGSGTGSATGSGSSGNATAVTPTTTPGTSAPANPSLTALYAQCGNMNTAAPDQTVFNQQLGGVDIVKTGTQTVLGFPINYSVTVTPSLTLQASTDQSVFSTSFQVVATPTAAQSTAEQEVNQSAGSTTSVFLPLAQRTNLASQAPAWANVLCTLQPTQQITSTVGGSNTVVQFNPPLPNSVSPLATTARYSTELAAPLTFSNIQATVSQSSGTIVTSGSTYTGTVTVASVTPTYSGTTGEGQPVTVNADLAYQVSVNFGTPAITGALGLESSTTFYIDTTAHTYKAIVSQTSSTDVPQVVFLSN